MLTACYFMLLNKAPYKDLGSDHLDRRDKTKTIGRLMRRLRDLGCEVEIKQAA